jgi:ABC-2 family transporter
VRLLGVELRRFVSRRLTQVLLVLALVAIATTGVIVAVKSTAPTAHDYAVARSDRAMSVEECAKHPRQWGVVVGADDTATAACERVVPPASQWVGDDRYDLSGLRNTFLGTSLVIAALGLILGSSFMGAEWHSGTIGTLLTWEPRRTRVMLAKLVACVAAVFVLCLAIQAILGAVLWLVAATRGVTTGTGGAWLRSVVGVAVRSAALGAFASAIGLAVATVGRNTAAALGAGFVYLGVIEGLLRGLRPGWQRWLVGDNATLFLTGTDNRYPLLDRSMTSSGLLLLAYAAAATLVAVAWFRARDVT